MKKEKNEIKNKIPAAAVIAPGLLIAATGVGAGDLAGGAFAGSKLGTAVLWAVLLGAFFKFVITEGLARFQLVTGKTLLEGLFDKYGKPAQLIFLVYLLVWSFAVGSAMISACGVAGYALFPFFNSPENGKIIFGIIHSLIGLIFVWFGTYSSFEKFMNFFVGIMFLTVIFTALLIKPDYTEIVKGIFIPTVPSYVNPDGNEQGVIWTLALMGGVGGTLTILSYGYWIKEKGRTAAEFLRICRIDLITAYIVTALFGMAMIIISSQVDLDKTSSALLVVTLSGRLKEIVGTAGSVLFLIGAWAAVFTSLLGVWQSVPYMFADFWRMFRKGETNTVDTKSKPYRYYLIAIAIVPMAGLMYKFVFIQKVYAFLGSFVIPLIAAVLLLLNTQENLLGKDYKNKPITNIILSAVILLFVFIAVQ